MLLILVLVFSLGTAKAQQVGAYSKSSVNDAEVIKAAKFAIRAEQKKSRSNIALHSITKAQTQVVAGLNYRLCLQVKVKKALKSAVVVIYRNLQNEYSLTSWEWRECK